MARKVRQTDRSPEGGLLEWPRPIYDRSWTDPRTGGARRMRGGQLEAKAARRLMRRADLLVLHAYGP